VLHPLPALNLLSAGSCNPDDLTICGVTYNWTGNKGLGQTLEVLLGTPLHILIVIAIAVLARRALHRFIDRFTTRLTAGQGDGSAAHATRRALRARTIASVLQSVTTALVFVVAGLMVIQQIGYSVAPLLASAGVVGVALAFGSQSLVKDVVSGMFMIAEDQYGVGDVIDVGNGVSGVVETVGLRVTRVRDVNGTVWFVRNGEIQRIGNQSQGWSRAVVDVDVPRGVDIRRVERLMAEEGAEMRRDEAFATAMLDDPEVWGVESMTKEGLVIRLVVRTQPLQQWPVARELRRRITARFETEGIQA
jgi:small conductance mechanosensitive channel